MPVYPWLYRTLIHRTDPEAAHHLALAAIAVAGRIAPVRGVMRATIGHLDPTPVTGKRPPHIGTRILPGRLGLAAGMDKDADAVLGMAALGFAFVEVGTVTPRPQPGNDRPRLWRLMDSDGLRNRMGFNNSGVEAMVDNLRELRSTRAGRAIVVGANIGKNKTTAEEDAAEDYRVCARAVAPWVDFVVVNVSSPNTPGLRDLQAVDHLRPILQAARRGCEEGVVRRIPLFVKIAPDLGDAEILEVVALTRELGMEGVVATNTTIDHDLGDGGVSGRPLNPRALEVVRLVSRHLGDDQVLIGTGGIASAEDARRMVEAGADLVEAFTAFVFEGATWPGRVNRALAGL
ncbi:MAG: quinone-dependent dihydroorotate dehydrogenase [Pauljensenia sp.]